MARRLPPQLETLLSRRLVVVSGKGGVGKTTVAAALGLLGARSGRRTLLLSSDGRGDAAALFGRADTGYQEQELAPGLVALTAEFDFLLADFVRTVVPVRLVEERILASSTFRYFTRATPGLPELLVLGKLREVFRAKGKKGKGRPEGDRWYAGGAYDLVVLDAPATGHALSLLTMPAALLRIVPAGPLRRVADDLDQLLSDPEAASLVVVTEPADFAARETEEMVQGALQKAHLRTHLVIVNRLGRDGPTESLPEVESPILTVPEIPLDETLGDEEGFFDLFVEAVLEPRPRARRRAAAPQIPSAGQLDLRAFGLGIRLLALLGPGGVGKTTLSAAAGIALAREGRRVLVMTVDPARRLAQALGLQGLVETPQDVPLDGLTRGGRLMAMQIDPKATFERLLPRIASEAVVDRIRRNAMYAAFVDTLPGVLEYMGVEALAEHLASGEHELIVLDTPPAARGLDFLATPDRMIELLENDALRWFLRGDSLLSRALSGASRGAAAVLKLADKALGFGFLSDLADFFRAFDGLYDGFQERSRAIREELRRGRFLVVASPDRSALRTAASLATRLAERQAAPGLLLNRVPTGRGPIQLPEELASLPCRRLPSLGGPAEDLPARLAQALAGDQPGTASPI